MSPSRHIFEQKSRNKCDISNLLNPILLQSEPPHLAPETTREIEPRARTLLEPAIYSKNNPSLSGDLFLQRYHHINEVDYPLTWALLHDPNIDKAKKKKGGYRCSGANCKENCTFTTIVELLKHLDELQTRNEYKFTMENCAYRYIGFSTMGLLKRHGRIHENSLNVFVCSHCGRSFKNDFNKQRHERLHHEKS